MKKIILFVTAINLSLGIWAKANKTAWIDNPYDGLEESRYVCATASGVTAEDADKKATSAVCAILMQSVDAEEKVSQSASSAGKDETAYLSDITTSSNIRDISGLSIKDRYKDKKNKTFYSRAIIDKTQAAKQYTLSMKKNSMEIDSLIESAEAKKGTFQSVGYLSRAYTLAKENDYFIAMLNVLKPQSKQILSYGSSSEIASKIRKAFNSIDMQIISTGVKSTVMAKSAAETLNKYGFSTKESSDTAYIFETNLETTDIGNAKDNEIYFFRYNVSGTLKERNTGKEILTFTANKRVGKLSKMEAEQAAVRAAQTTLQENFSAKLNELLQ